MKLAFGALMGVLLSLAMAAPAGSSTLYQSIPDLTVRPDEVAVCSGCSDRFQVYGGFDLETDALIKSIDIAVRAYAGACCFLDDEFTVQIYDGPPSLETATLVYEQRIHPLGEGSGPYDQFASPPLMTGYETAVVSFDLPSLHLLGGRAYSISLYGPDHHMPIYRAGSSDTWQDGGPFYSDIPRHEFVYYLPNGTAQDGGSLGFRLNGEAVPEPATWALL